MLRLARTIEGTHRLAQRWEEELRGAEGRLPLTGRLQNLFSDTRSFFKKFWGFEVFTAEDAITVDGQQITGKRSVTNFPPVGGVEKNVVYPIRRA